MIAWFKKFLFDETAFVGLVRAVVMGVGTAIATGLVTTEGLDFSEPKKVVATLLLALGGFIRGGDKNPPVEAKQ